MRGTKLIFGMVSFAGVLLALAACANDRGPHPNLPPLGIRTDFTSKNLCSLGVSPEIVLGNVPPNTATYRVRVTEVSTLRGPRWQGDLPASGPSIPQEALEGFDLPCPADKQTLTYRLEIMALAAAGQPLGYGWVFANARSIADTIESEQRRAKEGPRPPLPAPAGRPFFFIQ